ncbi:MAG: hypothetical protein IJR94_03895, partial [Synergistaceae bacterium]|nr:hypothetical protein [Synergistaceae bacterium]
RLPFSQAPPLTQGRQGVKGIEYVEKILAPRRPCKGRGTACGGRGGGEGHEVARGVFQQEGKLAGEGVISKKIFCDNISKI